MYYVEMTDTERGNLNYSWVKRYIVRGESLKECMRKISMETGFKARKVWSIGECSAMYKVLGAWIGYSVEYVPEEERFKYLDETLPVYVKCKQL
jgi:hypothetical protein